MYISHIKEQSKADSHDVIFNKIAIQARAQMAADPYRESTCTNLSVSCPYEIIAYSVLKHINTARMPLGKKNTF